MAVCATLALAGCTDWAGYDIDKAYDAVPVFSKMRRSVIPDPYEMPRLPAPYSIPSGNPSGDVPAPFTQAQLDSVAPTLRNPFPVTPAMLERGRLKYGQNCATCHGPAGRGDGPVVGAGKFPFAPTLVAGAATTRSDGYLYAIITAGRNFMPPYGERLRHEDRWAVAAYVRQLQGQRLAAPAAVGAAPANVTVTGSALAVPGTATPPRVTTEPLKNPASEPIPAPLP